MLGPAESACTVPASSSVPVPATTQQQHWASTPVPATSSCRSAPPGRCSRPPRTPVADPTGIVAGFADATGGILPLVCTLNAARVLDAIAGLLGVDHDELGALALQAEPGAGGAVLVPYFEGERTPNLPDATASLAGLTLANTTRANLARAAIEGMLCGLAAGLDAIRGVDTARILLIGGAAANPGVQAIAGRCSTCPSTFPPPASTSPTAQPARLPGCSPANARRGPSTSPAPRRPTTVR